MTNIWTRRSRNCVASFSPSGTCGRRLNRNCQSDGQNVAAALTFAVAGLLAWRMQLIPTWFEMQPAATRIVQQYEQQKAERLGELGPVSEDFGNWQYQLAVWDQAIWQVQSAMHDYPDDPVLIDQMESLYRQQLGYIQTIASVETYHY